MDVVCLVVSTNDVILILSCKVMKMGASYVKSLHKIEPWNSHFYIITSFTI